MRAAGQYVLYSIVAMAFLTAGVAAQADDLKIDRYVIANGGGTSQSAGTEVSGTSGQNAAGVRMRGGSFFLEGGFWSAEAAVTTSSSVSVSGRLTTSGGRAIRGGTVKITDQEGKVRSASTTRGGHFRFDEVEAGRVYVITAVSGRFQFTPLVIAVTDSVAELLLVAP